MEQRISSSPSNQMHISVNKTWSDEDSLSLTDCNYNMLTVGAGTNSAHIFLL